MFYFKGVWFLFISQKYFGIIDQTLGTSYLKIRLKKVKIME